MTGVRAPAETTPWTRIAATATGEPALFAGAAWFDPIEAGLRGRIRGFIEELVEQELTEALGRRRHERGGVAGHRHGHRERRLTGSFGPVEIAVPRARLRAGDGTTREWRSAVLPRYARMTRQVEALIAGAYLAGTNTRRVGRALGALFRGAVGKDVVSRTWRKVKTDWEAWCRRGLGAEDIVRLILDGTVVRVRLDRKATAISLLVVLGVRRDGQKVLLAVRKPLADGAGHTFAVQPDDLLADQVEARQQGGRWASSFARVRCVADAPLQCAASASGPVGADHGRLRPRPAPPARGARAAPPRTAGRRRRPGRRAAACPR